MSKHVDVPDGAREFAEACEAAISRLGEIVPQLPRHSLDSLDLFPEQPGIYAIYYNPEAPEADEEDPWGRPRFLELLAAEGLPLIADVAKDSATIRGQICDITQLLDQARGLSWTWFEASFIASKEKDDPFLRTLLNRYFRYTPWYWMSFDQLFDHQCTDNSACTLVVDGDRYPIRKALQLPAQDRFGLAVELMRSLRDDEYVAEEWDPELFRTLELALYSFGEHLDSAQGGPSGDWS